MLIFLKTMTVFLVFFKVSVLDKIFQPSMKVGLLHNSYTSKISLSLFWKCFPPWKILEAASHASIYVSFLSSIYLFHLFLQSRMAEDFQVLQQLYTPLERHWHAHSLWSSTENLLYTYIYIFFFLSSHEACKVWGGLVRRGEIYWLFLWWCNFYES